MSLKTPKFLLKIKSFLDGIHIPFLGISLWKMFGFYAKGIFENQIGKQAAAISWAFFLSLFPFILFLLSLLPYLPHYTELQYYIFNVLMPKILPENILNEITDYIQTNLIPNLKKVNKLSILLALIFGTSGTHSLINGFNASTRLKRNFFKEYAISIGITSAFVVLIVLSIFGIYYSEVVLKLLSPEYHISWFVNNLAKIIGYISFPFFYFMLLSLFYWAGCMKITAWKQAIPGAVFTTVLFVLLTYLFAIYLKNFARYNVLYGSIGTIIIAMVWININIILMLLGNELNVSIKKIREEKKP
ncbi:MAG: YihY/virulence factor BrkB family protein [Flavobacteriaceae bacterium]|jgi:membrane protein|nr:YihY/virulence factor BrkB family protein [Flavobacteriaceae bacterium]